jgi:integrase
LEDAIMVKKLTALAVASAQPRRDSGGKLARAEIADAGAHGLYLVVQASGAKSWALRYRFEGRPSKLILGTAEDLPLAQARAAAASAQLQLVAGVDPAAARRASRTLSSKNDAAAPIAAVADTVAEQAKQFLTLHGPKLRARTLSQYQSVIDRFVLPAWGALPVQAIRRRDVITLVDTIAVDRPVMANRTLGVLSKFFNWLMARDVIETAPTIGVEMPGTENARERVLDDNELAKLWRALDEEEPSIPAAVLKLLLLTGARRSEIAEAQWSEIDEKQRLLIIPKERSKNRQAHTVPLSPQTWSIVEAQLRTGPYVFSVNGRTPVQNFTRIKSRLRAKLGFNEHWQPHDLRRSVASGLQRLGYGAELIEAILGHRSGVFRGIASVYQRHSFDVEKRTALEAWGRHIERLVSGKPANIVALGKRRR